MKDEIKKILTEIGDIDLATRLVCKMSPHTPPVILWKIKMEDIDKYDKNVLATILQRLKYIKAFGNN